MPKDEASGYSWSSAPKPTPPKEENPVSVGMKKAFGMAEGGEVDDPDDMMNHVALECMSAIESKDKELFKQSFQVLVSDILSRLENDESDDDNSDDEEE